MEPVTEVKEVSADERLLDQYEEKRREVLTRLLDASSDEAKRLRQAEKDLADIIKSLRERIAADTQSVREENMSQTLKRRNEALDHFIQTKEVRYLSKPNVYLLRFDDGEYQMLRSEAMMHQLPAPTVPHNKLSMSALSERVQMQGLNYIDREYRVGHGRIGYYNLFQADLCPIVPADTYHFAFDALMHSLGDGKAENIEHLEKWLICRYNQIAASIEDITYPALVFFNDGGGAGKGLLTEHVWPTVFGAEGVMPNASMNDITGSFNSGILNKVMVHINEAAMERTNSDALKQVLGSPTLTVNTKYLPAFPIKNIMAVMISGNDKFSVVKLTGSKIDRRFSVVRTDTDFLSVMKELVESTAGEPVSEEDVRVYIKGLCASVFGNRDEVGKWLYALQQRHPDLLHISALHGGDYASAVQVQKPLHQRVLERIFDDPQFTAIDMKMLECAYDTNAVIEGLATQHKRRRVAFRQDCREAAEKRGLMTAKDYDQNRNPTYIFHHPHVTPEKFNWSDWAELDAQMKHVSKVRLD